MLLAKQPPMTPRLDDQTASADLFAIKGDNPLIWPLLSLLQSSLSSWKVHHLAAELQQKGLMQNLDENPQKALFKQNFLLMNALFELQQILLPKSWLQVKSMEIQIFRIVPCNLDQQLAEDDALRDYYKDWRNYDTCPDIIQEMLESFWNRYENYIGTNPNLMHQSRALAVFELDDTATNKEIRRQWRRLALMWHPDRDGGDASKFREVCEAWQSLREKS
ncbi:molecular chaperone DnaJ [Shewanella colwelliana]|uniref:Molecular chaperone DnaJ n=1 Tax=Shewanella colwelliana TaxID=23 RepID=A0ABQ4PCW4_SHECO|nr:DNA-J related domain-containing protein [Shewanella colwelliana]MDX1281879.1 DNA-J related domain-containing protein [Shewanella colwelliana]GIU16929.1 molecular chaperone DnaJ [Shewanella colwelliana]GIU45368.1 molecular chaperone DnaJ [Shewanella colwelliana]